MNNNHSALYRALKGLNIAIVGGDARDDSLARLQKDFDLHRVVHCPTRRNDPSTRAFGAALHRPGIVMVVWLCGLSRTNHGKQLRAICRNLGIPWVDCVRIPHPHVLAARVTDLHLLDAIVRRRARLESLLKNGGNL
jgi:hypothetical protein